MYKMMVALCVCTFVFANTNKPAEGTAKYKQLLLKQQAEAKGNSATVNNEVINNEAVSNRATKVDPVKGETVETATNIEKPKTVGVEIDLNNLPETSVQYQFNNHQFNNP